MKHLAIFNGDAIEKILAGKKTIEARFSKTKMIPFAKVSAGDCVLMKQSGGEIIGQFTIEKVVFWDNLSSDDFCLLKKLYSREINVSQHFWDEKQEARYATLMFISESVRFLTPPAKFEKKDLRSWVVLNNLIMAALIIRGDRDISGKFLFKVFPHKLR